MNDAIKFNDPDSQENKKVGYVKKFPKVGGDVGREGRREKGDLTYQNSEKVQNLSQTVTNRKDNSHENLFKSELNSLGLNYVGQNDAPYAKAKER